MSLLLLLLSVLLSLQFARVSLPLLSSPLTQILPEGFDGKNTKIAIELLNGVVENTLGLLATFTYKRDGRQPC